MKKLTEYTTEEMIAKIEKYVRNGQAEKAPDKLQYNYEVNLQELFSLAPEAMKNPVVMMFLTWEYGREKGYRMAQAEARAKAEEEAAKAN